MSNLPVLEASTAAVLDAKGGRIGRLSFRGGGSRSNHCKRKPESTEGRPWGQSLKKPSGAPLNLG